MAKVDFSSVRWGSVEWTNLVTLYLRAYESRSPRPILGDKVAAAAVDRIDYDFRRIHRTSFPASNQYLVPLRAKRFDDWCAGFLRRRPDAVVSCAWVVAWTAGHSGWTFRNRCRGSTSISQASSSYAEGCTTTPRGTG